jgi:glycosyltransferase involved in cell wall biosynthesis
MPKIKVVHIITGLSTGGAEKMLLKLLTEMPPEEFDNVVISLTSDGDLGPDIRSLDIPVISLGISRGALGLLGFLKLLRQLHKHQPDLIQTWLYHADLAGLIAGRISGKSKIIWNLRCSYMGEDYYKGIQGLLIKLLARLSRYVDCIIANSENGQRLHQGFGYSPKRWDQIPNGFETNIFVPYSLARTKIRNSLAVPLDAPLIGMVGRFDPVKEHQTFVRAAQVLLQTQENAHFLLAGQGCDLANHELVSLIPEDVRKHFHLMAVRSDMPQITASLDIANCISIGEGFPNAVGEAMSCGVPCVVTDVGDCLKITGEFGSIVPISNPLELAKAWQNILDLPAEERQKIAEGSRKRIIEHYSIETVVNRYTDLYKSLS